jgi:hypothetical protein
MANNITREISPASIFEDAKPVISSATTFNQGDLLILDTSTHLIRLPVSDAECATFVGIARVAIVNGKKASPYQGTAVDAASAIVTIPGPVYGVIAKLTLKTGDAFNPGDLVYYGGAAQTISSTGTKAIGIYQGLAVASAVAGQIGEALVGHRFPGDALETA